MCVSDKIYWHTSSYLDNLAPLRADQSQVRTQINTIRNWKKVFKREDVFFCFFFFFFSFGQSAVVAERTSFQWPYRARADDISEVPALCNGRPDSHRAACLNDSSRLRCSHDFRQSNGLWSVFRRLRSGLWVIPCSHYFIYIYIYIFFFFVSDIVTLLYDAYSFLYRLKSQPGWTVTSLSLGLGRGGGGGGVEGGGQAKCKSQSNWIFFRTAFYFSAYTFYLPRPSLVNTMSCYFKPWIR